MMDPVAKMKDANCNGAAAPSVGVLCISESFTILPPPHLELVSANSVELNAAASLSDDSGVPLTTNSSISSGDSFRLGMCKLEIEMIESDGEVSQFDSLDNCSEGGMSAENFNTLKKGPIAPIDPPPEFQDSPQTTLVRSLSKNLVNSLRRWTSSQSSFEHLKDYSSRDLPLLTVCDSGTMTTNDGSVGTDEERTLKNSYAINKHLYSSDSILNCHTDNIYDEPNNIISTSLGNSVDFIESDTSSPLPPPPPPVSVVKIKQTLCPYYQDHTRYFKAIPSEQDTVSTTTQRFNPSGLSEIHDYDLYYSAKRTTYQQYENSLQRKLLCSPLHHSHHCHNHHYHAGVSARPNSRNSLNSRLSSSHNSLSVSSTNKPDDSIFITQAMSHDALLTREISDFYNVPIDSDIYAFPVDMIPSERVHHKEIGVKNNSTANETMSEHCPKHKSTRRTNRNKRKKRFVNGSAAETDDGSEMQRQNTISSSVKYREPVTVTGSGGSGGPSSGDQRKESLNSDEQSCNEPLHMTLDEVKQFYHTLYSDTKVVGAKPSLDDSKTSKSSDEAGWSVSFTRSRAKDKNSSTVKTPAKIATKANADNDNLNNNNNVHTTRNHNNQMEVMGGSAQQNEHSPQSNEGQPTKATLQGSEKKSQFSLNLKQKFCSIFRFRRSHNRCRSGSSEDGSGTRDKSGMPSQASEDKRKKFQTRALPPLPKKVEVNVESAEEKETKNAEPRPFEFTSSIEKVKDYGWYWGPLSSEAAEKVLSNEPDGSFIVRDSSDDHYIFSLSFKLNNCVRHVRIEQDQGTFSFGSYAKFKSQTITEFIEKAVEHSRSGRYLFFLHRRPEHGPMRVQLTNPVSRFKHVQSLQHMCRFVILKAVIRKDLIQTLPLPRRLLDYINYKHCYSEQVESDSSHSQISGEGSL